MLVKILGVLDLMAAFLIFVLSFGFHPPELLVTFFVVILLLKGGFILTGSIASGFDLLGALVLFLSLYYSLPQIAFFIPGLLILQKGFLSFV